ncbi:MAG: tetratricopeptide repeat protein [Desulfofustis sp.]|nr:tetratricopeptide repeat protein [Desulfofustis sp.]
MTLSNRNHLRLALLCLLWLLLAGCSQVADSGSTAEQAAPVRQDLSCSYFYFLWGTHAEYEGRFEEAADAYQKALVCDPTARYISSKLPLVYLKNSESAQAITLLMDNIDAEPDDTASRMLLARLYVQQKKYHEAIAQYEAVLDLEPEHEEAMLRLGILLDQTGQRDKGRRMLTRLVTRVPESYLGHLALARMAESSEDALASYQAALQLNWSVELCTEIAQYHIDRKEFEAAVELLNEAVRKQEDAEQARLLLALALLGQGQEEAAVAEISVIPQYRNNPELITQILSKLHVRLGNYQAAIDHLQALLSTADNSEARYLLGAVYSDLERYDEAFQALAPIGPEADEFEDAVFLRAKILHQDNRIDEAISLLETYLASETTARPTFYIVACSLYRESGRDAQALSTIENGFRRFPGNERILFEYGLQLERDGQQDQAIAIMERLLEIDPDHAEALNFVGYTWADTNRHLDKALAYIVRAVELRPGNGYIQDSLGWVHFRLGNLERARDELLYAIELLPDDPQIHDHLGDVYRALKENRKAVQAYRQALKLFEEGDKQAEVQKKIDALRKP